MGRTSDARQRLMDAANSLICEYSYGAVTVDAICERAAVKKGSFYYFFDSKSDLAVAAIDAWWNTREKVVERIFGAPALPLEKLRAYFDFVTGLQLDVFATSGQILGCPLFTLGAEICFQDERIRARIMACLAAGLKIFATTIAEAQAAGDLPPGDPEAQAALLMSVYEGTLTLARIERNPERVRTLTSQALAGIGAHEMARLALAEATEGSRLALSVA